MRRVCGEQGEGVRRILLLWQCLFWRTIQDSSWHRGTTCVDCDTTSAARILQCVRGTHSAAFPCRRNVSVFSMALSLSRFARLLGTKHKILQAALRNTNFSLRPLPPQPGVIAFAHLPVVISATTLFPHSRLASKPHTSLLRTPITRCPLNYAYRGTANKEI